MRSTEPREPGATHLDQPGAGHVPWQADPRRLDEHPTAGLTTP
jgi:hypothetical protein